MLNEETSTIIKRIEEETRTIINRIESDMRKLLEITGEEYITSWIIDGSFTMYTLDPDTNKLGINVYRRKEEKYSEQSYIKR